MAVSMTPKSNRLFSGKLSVYEEQLFCKRINAVPKTMARQTVQPTPSETHKKLKGEGE
tara:strand:- start:2203 stop:2376 length:174 start_codon:yes stop_codon:yes gene_type:complete